VVNPAAACCHDQLVQVNYLFAAIPVSNRDASQAWYGRLFDGVAVMQPNDREAMWQLVGSGSLYVVVDPRAGSGIVSLVVDDLDLELAGLASRGLEVAELVSVGEAGRKALLHDPDGNEVWLIGLDS
jgi:hypothetical protein